MYDMKNDPKEMTNVFDRQEYSSVRQELAEILRKTQEQYKDNDPDETERVLFKGDERYTGRKK